MSSRSSAAPASAQRHQPTINNNNSAAKVKPRDVVINSPVLLFLVPIPFHRGDLIGDGGRHYAFGEANGQVIVGIGEDDSPGGVKPHGAQRGVRALSRGRGRDRKRVRRAARGGT